MRHWLKLQSDNLKEQQMRKARMKPEILREHRKSRRESQSLFWSRFGVSQSRGSRFEMGTEIPSSIAILLQLYLNGKISDHDLPQPER